MNSNGLTPGVHTTSLFVSSNSTSNSYITIPVTLTVVQPSPPSNLHSIVSGNVLELHWDVQAWASSYNIYEAETPDGTWSMIGTSATNSFSKPLNGSPAYRFYRITGNQ